MANYSTLITDITAKIYENAGNDITGQDLQDVLLEMVQEMGQSGMVCLGIADGNTNPPGSSDSNIFYIAGEGTYSNFGGLTVNAGEIALFIWDGATWTKQSVTTTDPNKADKVAGATAGDLAGLNASGNLTDSGIPSNNVAQQDGYYSTLTAGTAENLVGRGTVLAEYTRRTSGGSADIGTGAATISKIHGNTIVWNQYEPNATFADGTTGYSGYSSTISASDGKMSVNVTSAYGGFVTPSFALISGHKYLLRMVVNCPASTALLIYHSGNSFIPGTTLAAGLNVFTGTATAPSSATGGIILRFAVVQTYTVSSVLFFDLTQMGLESITTDEFNSLFPLNYYAYNTGSLVSLTATGINTTGFNQWDEEWENGEINSTTGADAPAASKIRSKNYIPVFPSTAYYIKVPAAYGASRLAVYDIDKNYIGTLNVGWFAIDGGKLFTTPANGYYVRFFVTSTTYNNDICFNISWSGYRNGEYEAYWDSTLALPITTVTSGGSAIFSDGMKGIGGVYDELTSSKAVKRIAQVNLGSLSWTHTGGGQFISGDLVGQILEPIYSTSPAANCVCPKYPTLNYAGYSAGDKCLMIMYSTFSNHGYIYIKDSSYSDAPTFKTAMNGVYMAYELKTYTEYTLDSELNLGYSVDDFGTEEEVPQNTSTPSTAPIIYDVKYAMNAVDTLRNLPTNYISKDSLKNLLDTMQSAGIFSAYTMTYNAGTEQYTFTITV